jgi:hypothetical protein
MEADPVKDPKTGMKAFRTLLKGKGIRWNKDKVRKKLRVLQNTSRPLSRK